MSDVRLNAGDTGVSSTETAPAWVLPDLGEQNFNH